VPSARIEKSKPIRARGLVIPSWLSSPYRQLSIGISLCKSPNAVNCSENVDTSLSYHHSFDERYPLVTDPLHTIYERQAAKETGKGVTWHRPAERMTYTQIYNKVGVKSNEWQGSSGTCPCELYRLSRTCQKPTWSRKLCMNLIAGRCPSTNRLL